MDAEILIKTIELANLAIQKTNEINKRIVTAIIVLAISASIAFMVVAGFYFFQR
jgi:hypothetical protein